MGRRGNHIFGQFFDKLRVFLSFCTQNYSVSIDYVETQHEVMIHLGFLPYKLFKVIIYKLFIGKSSFFGTLTG